LPLFILQIFTPRHLISKSNRLGHGAKAVPNSHQLWKQKTRGRFLLRDLALSVPIFRRSGSASGSQLWLSPNHSAPTNSRSRVPHSSKITVAVRTFSPSSITSCLARVSLTILEDAKMTVCPLSPLEDRSSVESNACSFQV
jgi:hypothetical protein